MIYTSSYQQAKQFLASLPEETKENLASHRRYRHIIREKVDIIGILTEKFDLSSTEIANLLGYEDRGIISHHYRTYRVRKQNYLNETL